MITGAFALVAAGLATAFWPRAVLVDIGSVSIGPMQVTINEEGRTKVRERYVVSAPVAGELQRVTVHPGDKVIRGESVVARMRPVNPDALDIRTREQARAAVMAAEAALRVARADLNAAIATRDFADSELERMRTLIEKGIASQVAQERAQQEARVARAHVETFVAAIAMREAELENARALLIGFEDRALATALGNGGSAEPDIPLYAPIDGTILQVIQESETTLAAGAAILEIGDVDRNLEIVAELLSSDAVQISVGDPVIVTNWGGPSDLGAEIYRIEPFGFTKYSALGVEEQRVNTTIRFTDPPEAWNTLGHGYRVEVRIVVWQDESAMRVPSSALFRRDGAWSVFAVAGGRARLTAVVIGHNNGVQAEVLEGLSPGDRVVLYPSAGLIDEARVAQRVAN